MKLIVPIYVVSIGTWLIGVVSMFFFLPNSTMNKPATFPIVFIIIGLIGSLIASSLREQHKRIEKLESQKIGI